VFWSPDLEIIGRSSGHPIEQRISFGNINEKGSFSCKDLILNGFIGVDESSVQEDLVVVGVKIRADCVGPTFV